MQSVLEAEKRTCILTTQQGSVSSALAFLSFKLIRLWIRRFWPSTLKTWALSHFWVPEHAIIPLQTSSPYPSSAEGIIPDEYGRIVDPFIALARASAVTQTIRLGTGICLVPEHNPLHLAKVIASLDHSSGDALSLALGRAGSKKKPS